MRKNAKTTRWVVIQNFDLKSKTFSTTFDKPVLYEVNTGRIITKWPTIK